MSEIDDKKNDIPKHDIILNPSGRIIFHISTVDKPPKSEFTIANQGDIAIAFKVKTTQPRRYLVRPNQGIVLPGETGSVRIIIVAKEAGILLNSFKNNTLEANKDKFLVQSVVMENELAQDLKSQEQKEASEGLARFWQTVEKKNIRNKRVAVEFDYKVDDKINDDASIGDAELDQLRRAESPTSSLDLDKLEIIRRERERYDRLMEYAVRMTRERNETRNQLMTSQKIIAKQKIMIRSDNNDHNHQRKDSNRPQPPSKGGLHLIQVAILAFIAFLLGKFVF